MKILQAEMAIFWKKILSNFEMEKIKRVLNCSAVEKYRVMAQIRVRGFYAVFRSGELY